MNAVGIIFTLVASFFLIFLPRRLAVIPLLFGVLYVTRQVVQIGPAHFTVVQILIIVGIIRVILRGEIKALALNRIDLWLTLWAVWYFFSSAFHTSDAWLFRTGVLCIAFGGYFLFRVFFQDKEDVKLIFKVLTSILAPVAILMVLEKFNGINYIAALGGVTDTPDFRNGHFRAQGAFSHSTLAGTVGAACFPMALYLWNSHRKLSLLGLLSAGGIVFAATSSGPVMMLLFILFGLSLWKIRHYVRLLRWLTFIAVIALDMFMKAPVYFLMARIDFVGGSTGWHRAQLILVAIEHLDEWWLVGTDYTRHWMATGIPANDQHIDITNQYLAMGVSGGLLLMLLFIFVLAAAFNTVGKELSEGQNVSVDDQFLSWVLGVILFGYVWNFMTIPLFDQSMLFFHLTLASIGAVKVAQTVSDDLVKTTVVSVKQHRYVRAIREKAS